MQSAPNSSFLKHLFPAFERNMESAFYLQFGDAKAKYNKLQLISTIKINPAGCLVSSAAGFVRVIKLYRKLQLQLKKRGFARIEFLHRAAAHLAICPNGKFFLHKSKSIMIPTFQLFVKLLLSEI